VQHLDHTGGHKTGASKIGYATFAASKFSQLHKQQALTLSSLEQTYLITVITKYHTLSLA
jgi:hypothetical protein